jgi:hypothetical protein
MFDDAYQREDLRCRALYDSEWNFVFAAVCRIALQLKGSTNPRKSIDRQENV